jgi:hypothetical protein
MGYSGSGELNPKDTISSTMLSWGRSSRGWGVGSKEMMSSTKRSGEGSGDV